MNYKNTLSIIIPVYNEEKTIKKIVDRVKKAPLLIDREIIIIDDCSKDNTAKAIQRIPGKNLKKIFLKKNRGKGGAIKEGIKYATGKYVIFQDADLEYDPNDYQKMLNKIKGKKNIMVLGNRFTKNNRKYIKDTLVHYLGNKFLVLWFNLIYWKWIPDTEPCYKLFLTQELKTIRVNADRFEYDIELMCKLAKKGAKFLPVDISYAPRNKDEGKKISWKDGVIAAKVMFVERFKK
jgi:glycosyltransferase involved in cell wall biosynthesis